MFKSFIKRHDVLLSCCQSYQSEAMCKALIAWLPPLQRKWDATSGLPLKQVIINCSSACLLDSLHDKVGLVDQVVGTHENIMFPRTEKISTCCKIHWDKINFILNQVLSEQMTNHWFKQQDFRLRAIEYTNSSQFNLLVPGGIQFGQHWPYRPYTNTVSNDDKNHLRGNHGLKTLKIPDTPQLTVEGEVRSVYCGSIVWFISICHFNVIYQWVNERKI